MREILFRGKTTHKEEGEFNNVWVYGDLIKNGDRYYIHPQANVFNTEGELSKLMLVHEVIPETVGQWTGLVDKNGAKIFEGDVLDTLGFIVTYKADTREGYGMDAGWYIQRDDFEGWGELENVKDHVVLGNIYDHPELLEKGR